jgi:aryl-alcohol dehydrogenase-like predicted oxidoreductase
LLAQAALSARGLPRNWLDPAIGASLAARGGFPQRRIASAESTTLRSTWPISLRADIAFGWLASKPFIPSVIAGASTPEQVDLNCKAVTCNLSAEELAKIDAVFAKTPAK